MIIVVLVVVLVFITVASGLRGLVAALTARPLPIIVATALIAFEESLKSLRFLVVLRARGVRIGVLKALKIHFASFVIGVLTPAFSGSLPTVIAMLGDELGLDLATSASVALSISFFDSAIPIAVVAATFWLFLPGSLLVLLIAIVIALAWVVAFNVKLSARLRGFLGARFGRERAESLDVYVDNFRRSLREFVFNRSTFPLLFLISVASYIIESWSLLVLSGGSLGGLLAAFLALMMSYVGGNVPLPGGEGGVEYSLLLAESRSAVIAWRTSYLLVAFASLALLKEVVKRYQGYAVRTYMLFRKGA